MSIKELIETEEWKKFMRKLEKTGSIFAGIAFILSFGTPLANPLFITGFGTLAIVYFFSGFYELKTENRIITFLFYKIYGFALTFSCISIVFYFMNWPFFKNSLSISIIGIMIAIFFGLKYKKTEENVNLLDKLFYIRLVIALGLLIFVLYLSQNKLVV